ncbi:usg protein [Pedomonas mirosovicensis]|uniref:usg protein n=1 Tax=Pedomonas mirosovicensis TaxID=2908641 RepID=UPI002169A96D|nr:usg protein [Pedomonas mirosovicensis]MCH8685156.1 usg protein [Pedomonas mirosovicensis]
MTMRTENSTEFELRLKGYSLLTAEILYWMPDHHDLLQSFVWQTLDIAPRFPRLHRFLDYWREHIEAPLHSIQITHASLVTPAEMKLVGSEFRLH